MPTGPNPILSSTNTLISVTNYAPYTGSFPGQAGSGTESISQLGGIPLTTSDNSATGQICLPVKLVNGGSSGGTFNSTTLNATSSGSIAEGVLSWSITALSGTVTVDGATIPVGASVSGGGYAGYTLNSAINYVITSGSALVNYDTPV